MSGPGQRPPTFVRNANFDVGEAGVLEVDAAAELLPRLTPKILGVAKSREVVLRRDPAAVALGPPHVRWFVEGSRPLFFPSSGGPAGLLCGNGVGRVGINPPSIPRMVGGVLPPVVVLPPRGERGLHAFVGAWGGMGGVAPPGIREEVGQRRCSRRWWWCVGGMTVVFVLVLRPHLAGGAWGAGGWIPSVSAPRQRVRPGDLWPRAVRRYWTGGGRVRGRSSALGTRVVARAHLAWRSRDAGRWVPVVAAPGHCRRPGGLAPRSVR